MTKPYMPDHEESDTEVLNLDDMRTEALRRLLPIELPKLYPAFGLLPDRLIGYQIGEEHLWERLRAVMDAPVQVFPWRGDKKVIQILRLWVLVVWANGRITPLRWHAKSCGLLELRSADPAELDLFQMGSRTSWYSQHRDATKWEYVQEHLDHGGKRSAPEPRSRNSAVFLKLRRRVLHYVRSRRLDSRIRHAMSLDANVMKLAVSLIAFKRRHDSCDVLVSSYNWVITYRKELETLQVDAPGLIQWFAGFCRHTDFPQEGEPVQMLKRHLSGNDVGRRGWLLLLGNSRTLLRQAIKFWDASLSGHGLSLIRVHASIGAGQLIPEQLLDLIVDRWGYPSWFWDIGDGVFNGMVNMWRQRAPQTSGELAEWVEVLDWMKEYGPPKKLNARNQKSGIHYLVRWASRCKAEQERRRLAALSPLRVWHEPITHDAWRLEFLRTARDLVVEGQTMSNCLVTWRNVAGSDNLFASVLRDGKHVGTVWFQIEFGRWRLQEAAMRFNQPFVADEMAELKAFASLIRRPIQFRAEGADLLDGTATTSNEDLPNREDT